MQQWKDKQWLSLVAYNKQEQDNLCSSLYTCQYVLPFDLSLDNKRLFRCFIKAINNKRAKEIDAPHHRVKALPSMKTFSITSL